MDKYKRKVHQFGSVSQSCSTLCDPIDCSTPGFPVHHQLPELAQIMSVELVMSSNHQIRYLFTLFIYSDPPVLFCFVLFFYFILQYCIGFAIHQHESATVYFKSFFVFSSFLHPSNVEDVRSCVTFFSVWFNVVFSGFGIYRYLIYIFY